MPIIFIPMPAGGGGNGKHDKLVLAILTIGGVIAIGIAILQPGGLVGARANPMALPILAFGISLIVIFGLALLVKMNKKE
jgi:hypothetical protein